jgi:cytochrome c-type biogenesis protein CcmE
MKRKQLKFAVGSIVIILTLSFLAYSGYQESKTYYRTVPELFAMKEQAYELPLQVSGDVIPGTIKRDGKIVTFLIQEPTQPASQPLQVKYVGKDPLPDTLIDRATAMATGKMGRDGVFVADKMLAKCASKYEKEAAAGVQITKKE